MIKQRCSIVIDLTHFVTTYAPQTNLAEYDRRGYIVVIMGVPQWTLTTLASSLHYKNLSILYLKRAPVMSIYIEGLPL